MRQVPKILLLLSLFAVFSSCEKQTFNEDDVLYDLGIMGRWEISSRTVNGTTDPTVTCCEFLVLDGDSTTTDLTGQWWYDDGDSVQTQGTYIVDTVDRDIQFYGANVSFSRNYQVVSFDVLFLRQSIGSTYIDEIWRRQY